MSVVDELSGTWSPRLHGVLRIIAGLLFMEHGLSKLFGWPHVAAFDHLQLFSLLGAAGVIETVCGLLIAIGLFTRWAAFIAAGEMAFAYFIAHFPRAFFPAQNGGDAAILYCFLFLYFVAAGAGAFSIDSIIRPAETPSGAPSYRRA